MIPPEEFKAIFLGVEGDQYRFRILGREYLLDKRDLWLTSHLPGFVEPWQVGEEVEVLIDGWAVMKHKGFGE